MYNKKVLDHFLKPRNVGEIVDADGRGKVGNVRCGDIMEIFLKIENDQIVDAKFKTFGCAAAIASSSMLTEMIKGMSLCDALKLTKDNLLSCLEGLPKMKVHCSVLGISALKKAIEDYKKKSASREVENKVDANH